MMASDDEGNLEGSDAKNPMTPKVRKFGTDLKTSARANRSSAKKVVKVRKSSTMKASRKTLALESTTTATTRQATAPKSNNNNNNNEASDLAYSVVFRPGSVGLKLEPVVESMGRQVGCRVLDFADGGKDDPGQARATKRIRPGDLLVAINGRDVISWNYPDIIALLRQTATANKRTMDFRSVWTPDSSVDTVDDNDFFNEEAETKVPATPVRKKEPSYDSSAQNFALTQSPAESVLHSHFLSAFQQEQFDVSEPIHELKPESVSKELSMATSARSVISESQGLIEPDIDDDDSYFSPSRVKELSASASFDSSSRLPPQKPLSNVVKTVYNSVAPAAGVVASSSYSLTSTLTSVMSQKLGEALVGHKSKDFDSAVQLKMQLLSELSQAKVTLDRNLEQQQRLERLGQQLAEERDSEREARESERVAREKLERDLAIVNEEKAALELQLERSKQKTTELSEQLQVEQRKLRNTQKDNDLKVRNLELQVESLSSQAEQDRALLDRKAAERERTICTQLSEATITIDNLNATVQRLEGDVKERDTRIEAAESTIESMRAESKEMEGNLRRSLEVAIETKEATENNLSDLKRQLSNRDGRLAETLSRLEQLSSEYQAMKDERAKTLEESKRLQALVERSDTTKISLESELVATREQSKVDADTLRSTIASLRQELAAKDVSLKTIVQTTNALQSEFNSCKSQLLALQATEREGKYQKLRIEEELRTSQIHTRQMEQLRDIMTEKDNKLASLDSQFREARECLEGMNRKLHDKIEALSAVSDREQKLKDENASLLDRIDNLECQVEHAIDERRALHREKKCIEMELSEARGQLNRMESILEEVEDSRSEAFREIEPLRDSQRKLTERNANLQMDLELAETKLAASGISFLSKAATIEELRSVLATSDATSSSVVAELETVRSRYEAKLVEFSELHQMNATLKEQSEALKGELVSLKANSSASERKMVDLQEKAASVEQQLVNTRKMLASSQSQVFQKEKELTRLKSELSRSIDVSNDKLRAVSLASRDIAILKDHHENELKRLTREFSAEKKSLEQSQELVIDRFKNEADQAKQLADELKEECDTVKRRLSEALETVRLQEDTMHEERSRSNKENQSLVSIVQSLDREKKELESGQRRLSQQVSLLSEQLENEKVNICALEQSRNVACEESRTLRSEMEEMQRVHLEDIEQMLNELDLRTQDDAAALLAKKVDDENVARIKDMERSLARSQKEIEDLRLALESCQKKCEETVNQLRLHNEQVEKEMSDRLFEKEEEIVSYTLRLDATDNSLAEAQVARRSLETKLVQVEGKAADASSEAERLSRRIVGMESDLSAMANEIEMLVATNEQLEQMLIEMKANRAAFKAEAAESSTRVSALEKMNTGLNAKIEESRHENLILQQKIENLKSDMYDLLAEKEDVEAGYKKAIGSVAEKEAALKASQKATREMEDDRNALREQLKESSENLFMANEKIENLNSDRYDLMAEKETIEAKHEEVSRVLNETSAALEASQKANQVSDADRTALLEKLGQTSEKLYAANRSIEEQNESAMKLKGELDNLRLKNEHEIAQRDLRIKSFEKSRVTFEQNQQRLQKDLEQKDSALACHEEKLASLQNELERRTMELSSMKAESREVSTRANELRRRLETTESLLEESKASEKALAKLEVSNRSLMNRIAELEATQDETMHDLRAAESSLASSVNLSKELKQQVDSRAVEIDRLKAQVQILESTITRMKSERLLQEEATQQLKGELARAAQVKVERAVSSMKNESDSKARNLVELAAKVTSRSRLIAQSKLFERTLMSFIEKLMERIEILLDTVSTHSLMLKSAEEEKLGTMTNALDLAIQQGLRSSSMSCDALLQVVTKAKRDFEEFKQEMQVLRKGAESEERSTGFLMPPPTPKHTALSSNLAKMKAMLRGDESSLRELADYMELQIDGLIADLFAARRALEFKEEALAELEDLVSMQQSEKESLDKNLKSMQVYIKEMERRVTEAESSTKNEGPIDSTKKAAMKTVAARALGNILLRDTNASAGQALRKWSNHACATKSIDQQKFVAEALAKQLEITREKVAILKSHLKHSHHSATTARRDSSGSRQRQMQ